MRDGGAQPLPLRQARHPALLPRVAEEEAHLDVKGDQFDDFLAFSELAPILSNLLGGGG